MLDTKIMMAYPAERLHVIARHAGDVIAPDAGGAASGTTLQSLMLATDNLMNHRFKAGSQFTSSAGSVASIYGITKPHETRRAARINQPCVRRRELPVARSS